MRPNLTEESVRSAMREFDEKLRNSAEWATWLDNKAHKYAIAEAGLLYPVKKIASLAGDVPVSDFSGGRHSGQANEWLRKLGFEVVPLHNTNPDWSRDELIP